MTDRTPCRTASGGSVRTIPTWKFDACRTAILSVLADGGIAAKEIPALSGARLSAADMDAFGMPDWHMMQVLLEIEVRGEIARIPGAKPVTFRLAEQTP